MNTNNEGIFRALGPEWRQGYRETRLAIVLLLIATIGLLLPPLLKLFFTIPLDYNEGWNAGHTTRAMRGENIYVTPDALIVNNYPPLSFYLVGLIGQLIGDHIVAGRLISFISFIVVGVNISLVTHVMSRDVYASIFSGLFFFSVMGAHYDVYIGMNDPQMLAHAVMSTGLLFFLRDSTDRRLLVTAVLLGLAGMIKHNLIALPLALTGFIFLEERRSFVRWLIYCVGILLVGIFFLFIAYGPAFFEGLASARMFSRTELFHKTSEFLLPLQIPLGFWLICSAVAIREKHFRLISLYILISLLTGFLFTGRAGAGYNIFFDLVISLAIGSGLGLAILYKTLTRQSWSNKYLLATLPIALCLGVLLAVPGKIDQPIKLWSRLKEREARTLADVAYMVALPGPALCESIALCYWARKEFEYDPFNMQQAFAKGRKDEDKLLSKLESHYYAVIQIDHNWYFSRQFTKALEANYRLARISHGGNKFFIPKQ